MAEIGTHSVIERADVVTLDLTVRATQFYPNRFREWKERCHRRNLLRLRSRMPPSWGLPLAARSTGGN
jgi:hypothetical protein